MVVALAVLGACSSSSSHPSSANSMVTVAITGVDDVHCSHVPRASHGGRPLPPRAMAALARLGRLESSGTGLPSTSAKAASAHELVAVPANPTMSRADAARLRDQLRVAARAACGLLDTQVAEAAGYFLSSPNVQGVGTHWIDWSAVNRPFDPARPSMLLFSAAGAGSRLVGFSYWVRSTAVPVGFAGGADAWHRHFGLCFDRSGQWSDEEMTSARCDGTYLNGRDLWMLHAWIVPGFDNPSGVFAPFHRGLCQRNVPDIAECPRGEPVR